MRVYSTKRERELRRRWKISKKYNMGRKKLYCAILVFIAKHLLTYVVSFLLA